MIKHHSVTIPSEHLLDVDTMCNELYWVTRDLEKIGLNPSSMVSIVVDRQEFNVLSPLPVDYPNCHRFCTMIILMITGVGIDNVGPGTFDIKFDNSHMFLPEEHLMDDMFQKSV